MSESELEEIQEQLSGDQTTKQLAEFKARALGDLQLADHIRSSKFTHQQLMEYLEDETVLKSLPAQVK